MTNEAKTTLLEFPCRFSVKAMGKNSDTFQDVVTAIVLKHATLWPEEPVSNSPSKAGNFVSITAIIEAESQQQLDAIYQDLTDCDQVMMAL